MQVHAQVCAAESASAGCADTSSRRVCGRREHARLPVRTDYVASWPVTEVNMGVGGISGEHGQTPTYMLTC